MFSRIFIERPRLAIVISLVLVLAGALCIMKLHLRQLPSVQVIQVQVRRLLLILWLFPLKHKSTALKI